MKKINIIVTLIVYFFVTGCHKEIVDVSDLDFGSRTEGNTEIDNWLKENYLDPYNIEVMYKWDASELSTTNTLVPPEEKHIIPVMDMIKKAWIDVYNTMGDPTFIKKYSPKQYLLVGSAEYNSSGGLTLGTAEGGTKIVIFRVNWFDLENRPLIKRILKTVHHEYVHILNQKKKIPDDFELISAANYTSTFSQLNDAQARELGFITPYSASAPGEDFAEMASVMLTEGREGYQAIIASISSSQAVSHLRQKEAAVVDYYKTYWGIDFYEMISKTEEAISDISPIDLNQYIGKDYNYIDFDINDPTLWGARARQALEASKQGINALGGRQFDYFRLYFSSNNPDKVDLQVRFALADLTQTATATYYLKPSYNAASNKITFSDPTSSGSNGDYIMNAIAPFLSYLTSAEFKIKFKDGYGLYTTGENIGGLVSSNDPNDYAYGLLNEVAMHRLLGNTYKYINLSIHNERLWHGEALQVVKNLKSNQFTANARKFTFLRINYNSATPNNTSLFSRFLLYSSLNAYNHTGSFGSYQATLNLSLETNYDRENNILEFKQVTTGQSSIYDIVKPGLDVLTNYLTSRKFKVSFKDGSNLYTIQDSYAILTNIEDPSDYIEYPIEPLKLQYILGDGFFKFALKEANTEFRGAALTAFNQSKEDFINKVSWEDKGRELSYYILNILPHETNPRAELHFRFTHINSTAGANAQVNFNIDFDPDTNILKLSNPVGTGSNATNVWIGLQPFLDYLTQTTFRVQFSSGTTYSNNGWMGSLININNANDYIKSNIY